MEPPQQDVNIRYQINHGKRSYCCADNSQELDRAIADLLISGAKLENISIVPIEAIGADSGEHTPSGIISGKLGRKPVLTAAQKKKARVMYSERKWAMGALAKYFGVSKSVIQKAIREGDKE